MVGTLQRSIPADQPSCVIERPACGSQIASLEFLDTTPSSAVVAAPGASVLDKRQGQKLQVPEQHHRARSSGDQATLRVDDWIQVVCQCRYHDLGH
jgi:hypothetical protein